MTTDPSVAGVGECVSIGSGFDPAALPQAGERAGSGAGTQAFGRDDATIGTTGGGTQQQGLYGACVGVSFGRGSMAVPGVIEGAVIHSLGDQEAKLLVNPPGPKYNKNCELI